MCVRSSTHPSANLTFSDCPESSCPTNRDRPLVCYWMSFPQPVADAPTPTPDYNAIHGRFLPGVSSESATASSNCWAAAGWARSTAPTISNSASRSLSSSCPASVAEDEIALARLRNEVRLARQIFSSQRLPRLRHWSSRRSVLPLHGIRRRRRPCLGPEEDGPSFP